MNLMGVFWVNIDFTSLCLNMAQDLDGIEFFLILQIDSITF